MAFDTKKQWLQQQLSATRELLQMSEDSILMKMSLESRIAELEEEIMEAIQSCSVDPDTTMIEMCKLVPIERVSITLDEELEIKFNFIKRHSDNPEDLQLAREIAGLPN